MRFQQPFLTIPAFDAADWSETARVFEACPARELGQAWRDSLESNFEPARVRFGWRDSTLWLYTELRDLDIYNAAERHNEPMWTLGDTLELFLKPPGGEAYYEFHITPDNYVLQLRFPAAGALAGGMWTDFLVDRPLLQSHTLRETEQNRWRALIGVDYRDLCADDIVMTEGYTLFSVSRYDWTRGNEEPVISSTSPHQKPWFHRQEEWGELVWQPAAAPPLTESRFSL